MSRRDISGGIGFLTSEAEAGLGPRGVALPGPPLGLMSEVVLEAVEAVAAELEAAGIAGGEEDEMDLLNCRPPEVVTAATEATAEATAAAFFIFCFSRNLRIISPVK